MYLTGFIIWCLLVLPSGVRSQVCTKLTTTYSRKARSYSVRLKKCDTCPVEVIFKSGSHQVYYTSITAECCEGFRKKNEKLEASRENCIPPRLPCIFECANGQCSADDDCICDKGHEKHPIQNFCMPIICKAGYKLIGNDCKPECTKTCYHGRCVAPEKCSCYKGYHLNNRGECVHDVCKPSCGNGSCLAGNKCSCKKGYKLGNSTTSQCVPSCRHCEAPACVAPGRCKCPEYYVAKYITENGETCDCAGDCDSKCDYMVCNLPTSKPTTVTSTSPQTIRTTTERATTAKRTTTEKATTIVRVTTKELTTEPNKPITETSSVTSTSERVFTYFHGASGETNKNRTAQAYVPNGIQQCRLEQQVYSSVYCLPICSKLCQHKRCGRDEDECICPESYKMDATGNFCISKCAPENYYINRSCHSIRDIFRSHNTENGIDLDKKYDTPAGNTSFVYAESSDDKIAVSKHSIAMILYMSAGANILLILIVALILFWSCQKRSRDVDNTTTCHPQDNPPEYESIHENHTPACPSHYTDMTGAQRNRLEPPQYESIREPNQPEAPLCYDYIEMPLPKYPIKS